MKPYLLSLSKTTSESMDYYIMFLVGITCGLLCLVEVNAEDPIHTIRPPNFSQLKQHYPGYAKFGGRYHNHQIVEAIGCDTKLLLQDTSALRLSASLNAIGGAHSLGKQLIRLSKFGRDSVTGRDGLEYMYHPIAYGPYFADKYGYPNVSKLYQDDLIDTKKTFWGKQGVLRVITYVKVGHMPKGHVALWDCNHFHQSRDWIAGHDLITLEFWESPDSDCSTMTPVPTYPTPQKPHKIVKPNGDPIKVRHHRLQKFLKKYYKSHKAKRGSYDKSHRRNINSNNS